MNEVILKADNVSKQYRLGLVGTGTLSHDLNRWWHRIRGKEDPYLKIGAVNDRSAKASEHYVWALRDINFEVEEGEGKYYTNGNRSGSFADYKEPPFLISKEACHGGKDQRSRLRRTYYRVHP